MTDEEKPDDEIDRLATCYNALSPLPHDAQRRVLLWLSAKLDDDFRKSQTETEPAGETP